MSHDCYIFTLDPLEKRKMTINFTDWLGGSTIASTSWVVPAGLTQESDSYTATAAINYFSGGTLGSDYEIACTITTADAVPRQKTQRFTIECDKVC